MFEIKRIDRSLRAADEPLGSKPKFWFYEDGRQYLFKADERGTGEDWAEKIACHLCELLGLPHVHYELAVEYDGDNQSVYARTADDQSATITRRDGRFMKSLFVAWRSGEEAGWGPVGRLEFDGQLYRFYYVRGAQSLKGFRPFPGMDQLDQVYESDELFPLFANRLLTKARREYDDFLRWGGFDPNDPPDPIAILGVTEGIRQTDAIEVFPCPVPDSEGCYLNKFFLHGIRWRGQPAMDRIAELQPGEELVVIPDEANQADPMAVGVHTLDNVMIGYVPRYLAHDVRKLMAECGGDFIDLSVALVNPDAPLRHRVLCRLEACWPDGFEPCAGEAFEPIPPGVSARCE